MSFHPEVVLLTKPPHDIYVDTNVSLGKTCIAGSHIVGPEDSLFSGSGETICLGRFLQDRCILKTCVSNGFFFFHFFKSRLINVQPQGIQGFCLYPTSLYDPLPGEQLSRLVLRGVCLRLFSKHRDPQHFPKPFSSLLFCWIPVVYQAPSWWLTCYFKSNQQIHLEGLEQNDEDVETMMLPFIEQLRVLSSSFRDLIEQQNPTLNIKNLRFREVK